MNYRNDPHIPPPYSPEPWYRPIRRNANIVCFGLFTVLLLGIFLTPVFTWLSSCFVNVFGIGNSVALSVIDMSCELIVTCLMFALPIVIMRLLIGIPTAVAFPMRRPRPSIAVPAVFICLSVSAAGALTYGIIVALLQAFFGITPYMPTFSAPTGAPALILYLLRVVLVPAVFEELLFRGVIMQSLRRFGDMFALVCSSILFALAHRNLAQGLSGLMVGLVIGFFVLRTGSLRTGMLVHFVNNAISVAADLISRNMPATEIGIFANLQFAFYIFSGLVSLAILLIFNGRIFHLAPSGYPVPEKRKYSVFFLTVTPVFYVLTILAFTLLNFQRRLG